MLDVAAISVAVGAALPATFTFLYQRLEHLLDARSRGQDLDPVAPGLISGTLQLPLVADEAQLHSLHGELQEIHDALGAYARGLAPITTDDAALLRILGRLRGTLEGIYGHRLTFAGEEREVFRPCAEQDLETVYGQVTAMEAEERIGDAHSFQKVTTVKPGATVVGMRARQIGTPPSSGQS